MTTQTARLGLDVPAATDTISGFPAEAQQALGVLDNAKLITQGTLASRPSAASTPPGNEYYATDTGTYYKNTGSAWMAVPAVGPWAALTLSECTAAPGTSPAARVEGDTVRLRGTLVATANLAGGTYPIGLPAACATSSTKNLWIGTFAEQQVLVVNLTIFGASVMVNADGPNWLAGWGLALDGQTFSIA